MTEEHFKVSTHLKDIIGRDLVTNEFVAVFELVKNAFDARASRVEIGLDLDNGRIWIVDDGKGMDADRIRDRWLFVAYSAKADGTEDLPASTDYRDRIHAPQQYAGSKGIGRFSCDTLGGSLVLYSRPSDMLRTHRLSVQWTAFEEDSRDLFQGIGLSLETADGFPESAPVSMPAGSGTVLRIDDLRTEWSAERIGRLRRYLEKLIDPFGTTEDTPVHISVVDTRLGESELARLQGPVGNNIRDVLTEKTTRILVSIADGGIQTQLVDRGTLIYCIEEESDYKGLQDAEIQAEIYYLNQSAKNTFTRRMGVRPVEFGSIFLFLNGFRIFPIGEETDDTFGLNRRKQQGASRYFGTRDVMGRIDVTAPPRMFRPASSRDAGLIQDAHVRDLYDAIRKLGIFRLERYVVGVTWKDKPDRFREDASGLSTGATRGRVAELIGQLASTTDLQLKYYDPQISDILDEHAQSFEKAMSSLVAIAERQGDTQLLRRIEEARARQVELERSEQEAAEAAHRAIAERDRADRRIAQLEKQARYLATTQDMTAEQMTLLLHQVLIYAGHIAAANKRALGSSADLFDAAKDIKIGGNNQELLDAAATIRVRTKRVIDDLEYIHLEIDRLMAVARFASIARFDLETDQLDGDVIAFLEEYITEVLASREDSCSIEFEPNGLSHTAAFRPVDLVVLVDNLRENARKHGATLLRMIARHERGGKAAEILVTDDGLGLDEDRIDPARIFDKGYTSTPGGSGLGLYHARTVMQQMDGAIQLDPERESGRATFVLSLPRRSG